MPIKTKNGSIGNAPGNLSRTSNAEPSSNVMTAARPVISQTSLALKGCISASSSQLPASSSQLPAPSSQLEAGSWRLLSQLADQIEDRQIHCDDDPADDDTEKC